MLHSIIMPLPHDFSLTLSVTNSKLGLYFPINILKKPVYLAILLYGAIAFLFYYIKSVGRYLAKVISKFHRFVEFPEDLKHLCLVVIPFIPWFIILSLNERGPGAFTFSFIFICLLLFVWISSHPRSFTRFLQPYDSSL